MLRYIAIVTSGLVLFFLVARHVAVVRFLSTINNDIIFENIYINGYAVGGMMPAEAKNALREAAGLDRQIIGFVHNDSLIYKFTFKDFGAEYDFSQLVSEAFLYGRTGSRRERYDKLRALEHRSHEILGQPIYRYNEALIPERLELVRKQASLLPVNAYMRLESAGFVITEGVPGHTPDMQEAAEQVKKILISRQPGQVELNMHTILPTYNAQHFSQAKSLLGSFYTPYTGGEEMPRNINIRLAAAHINNTVVYPGDVFSTREALGPITPEQGYTAASVIVDGQMVEDFGGGVCQVASTLYNAVLFAELPVIERANHSIKVQYLDFGFDAAIAGDYMDLKFKNNLSYPVLVTARASGGILEIQIYGRETRPPNRTLAFVSELIEVIPPEPERILIDDNLPSGHVLVSTEPRDGYRYELFRIIFIDGEQVEKEKINTSVYRPVQGVITKGP